MIRDVALAPDGQGVYFRVHPAPGVLAAPGYIITVLERSDRGRRIVAVYPFTGSGGGLVPGVVAPTPREERMHGCDPVAMPTPPRVASNADPVVHVRAAPSSLAPPGMIDLEAWLDEAVRGNVVRVTAQAETGHVEVIGGNAPTTMVRFDARGADLRPVPGPTNVLVQFNVAVDGRPREFVGRVVVQIDGEGIVRLPVPQPNALVPPDGQNDPLPIGERYGARIDAVREGDGFVLTLRTALTDPNAQIRWRASGGRIVPGADGTTVRFIPSSSARSPSVVVTVLVGERSVAVASWSP
jgi:hypothetical protein